MSGSAGTPGRLISEAGPQQLQGCLVQPLLVKGCQTPLPKWFGDHLNHELFDLEDSRREIRIIRANVDAVLGDDFFRRGTVYFDGVWTQAVEPDQRRLLRAVARRREEWTLSELETATHLDGETLVRQLRWAQRHDVLRKTDGEEPTWQFYVPLLWRWIRQFQSPGQGQDES